MVKESLKVDIEPEIIKWVLKSSGWTVEEISKKIKVNTTIVNNWLSGDAKPTLHQIETISNYLKRPLAIFFLSKPPQEQPLPHDYRILPDKSAAFTKKTLLAIRKARRLQSISKELLNNLNISTRAKIDHAQLSDNPDVIAARERAGFGINIEEQIKWKDAYQAFYTWRKLIEERNIMLFQISMPIEDARGFSLIDQEPIIIIVNISDSIEARNFTLLHEYSHILLNESGVCIPNVSVIENRKEVSIEKWCNEFAAAFLLPKEHVKTEFTKTLINLQESKDLSKFSHMYKISKAAILLNMLKLGFISKQDYQMIIDNMKLSKRKNKGHFIPPDKKCRQEKGEKFISLVSNNVNKGLITNNDALDYLSIKLRDFEKLTYAGADRK